MSLRTAASLCPSCSTKSPLKLGVSCTHPMPAQAPSPGVSTVISPYTQ